MHSEHNIDALDDRARFDARMAELLAFIERLKDEESVSAPTPPPVASAPDAGTLAPPSSHAAAPAPGASVIDPPLLRHPSKLAEAVAWLRRELADGPIWSKALYARAAVAGIARRTLERAKQLLGVRSEVDRRAFRRRWCWRLPGSGPVR